MRLIPDGESREGTGRGYPRARDRWFIEVWRRKQVGTHNRQIGTGTDEDEPSDALRSAVLSAWFTERSFIFITPHYITFATDNLAIH